MRFSGVRIAVFFFAVGDSQKQDKGIILHRPLFENAAVREAKKLLLSTTKTGVWRDVRLWAWEVTISPF